MSVSNPIIKEIKELAVKFLGDYQLKVPITDDNSNLTQFCTCLEKIFTKSLCTHYNSFGFVKDFSAWNLLENLEIVVSDSANLNYKCSLEYVSSCKNVFTSPGRLRLLLRTCLVKKCIHIPVLQLVHNGLYHKYYYPNSVLGDEILIQILLSVLLQCSKYTFKLELINSSFLDLSWILPRIVIFELVPCKNLGLSVAYANEKAVIVCVQPNSVAAEDGNIAVGDVLDELNGVHICFSTKGKLNKIMRKGLGKPISVKIIKALYNDDLDLYPPLIPLLRNVKLDIDIVKNKCKKGNEVKSSTKSAGYQTTYLGCVVTGKIGDVRQIDRSMRIMLNNECDEFGPKFKKDNKNVCFEIGEIGVKIFDPENDKVVFNHSYMEISSCGTVNTLKNYFAYIAGEEKSCNLSKEFTCYIFYCGNDDDIFTILQSIGQGFHRTHFAV